jgi:hypothetical protein
MKELLKMNAAAVAAVALAGGSGETLAMEGYYEVECFNPDGTLAWRDQIHNLVPVAGKNLALDTLLSGSAYTAAFYLGLVDGASAPTFNTADTAASHAGWTENQGYSAGTRPAPSFSAASAGVKATSAALSFTANATGTIAGCFIATSNVKGGAAGTVLSEGAFAGGSQAVTSGSIINVSYSLSM